MGIHGIALLVTLFLGAFRPGKHRDRNQPEFADEWWKGPPVFTEQDEKAAREEGFFDALDRWRFISGGKEADLGREKIKRMTKAQIASDLESEGVPFDALGEMSDEAIHLPLHPEYTAEHHIHVPKNEYERDAHVMGMCNRLIQIKERLAKYGLSLEMSPDEIPAKHRDVYQWARLEYGKLSERLAAFGENIEEIERAIDAGEILRRDFVDAPSDEEIAAGQYRTTASAVNTYGQSQKLTGTEHTSGSGAGGRGTSSQASPAVRLKEHEIAMMRERLSKLDDMMRDLGYDWNTEPEDAAAQDRGLIRQLIGERDGIARGLSELCESIDALESEMREEKADDPSSGSPEESAHDGKNGDADGDEGQEAASADSDQGTETEAWSGPDDGWDGVFEGFDAGE